MPIIGLRPSNSAGVVIGYSISPQVNRHAASTIPRQGASRKVPGRKARRAWGSPARMCAKGLAQLALEEADHLLEGVLCDFILPELPAVQHEAVRLAVVHLQLKRFPCLGQRIGVVVDLA